jgi:hypothetical protein
MFTKDDLNVNDRTLQLQEALQQLANGGTVNVRRFDVVTNEFKTYPVTISNLKKHPYEVICGNVYKTTFGLRVGDNVSEIIRNTEFFVERSIENYSTKVSSSNYDVELKRVSGEHLYLLDKGNKIPKGLTKISIEKRNDGNEVVQVDTATGNVIRKLSSMDDDVYVDKQGNQVIVTSNFDFYVNNTNFVNVLLSSNISIPTIEKLINSSNETFLKVLKDLDENLDPKKIQSKATAALSEFKKEIEGIRNKTIKL